MSVYDIKFKDLSLSDLEYLDKRASEEIHRISESEKVKAWKVVGSTKSISLDFYFYEHEFEKMQSLVVDHLRKVNKNVCSINIKSVYISIEALKDLIKEQNEEEYEKWLNGEF